MQKSYFRSTDLEVSLGVFFDSFIKIMIAITVFSNILNFSLNTIFQNIIPSFGISIFILQIFLFIVCLYMNKSDNSIIPLPSGISATRFFVWIFAIMIPTYTTTHNLNLSLAVVVGANFLSSLITMILSLFSNLILKFIPSPALFATVAGSSMAWLILSPLQEAFNTPIIAFICFFVILMGYIGNLKIMIPPLLLSIIIGVIISFITKITDITTLKNSTDVLGFYLPRFFYNLLMGVKEAYKFLPIILAITLVELISSIQGVEQAKKLNANYNTNFMIFSVSFISFLSSIIGNPFTLSILWGYSTWHKINASRNYVLYLGILFLSFGLTGISFFIMKIIPIASIIPIIIFIGIINIADTFKIHEEKYYIPIIIGMIFPLIDLFKTISSTNFSTSLSILTNGATLISLLWGSVFIFLIEKKYLYITIVFLICSILSFNGLIHSSEIKLFANITFSILYLLSAVLFLVIYLLKSFNFKKNI